METEYYIIRPYAYNQSRQIYIRHCVLGRRTTDAEFKEFYDNCEVIGDDSLVIIVIAYNDDFPLWTLKCGKYFVIDNSQINGIEEHHAFDSDDSAALWFNLKYNDYL